jgi:hypothetical protein
MAIASCEESGSEPDMKRNVYGKGMGRGLEKPSVYNNKKKKRK